MSSEIEPEIKKELNDLQYDIGRSSRYHMLRSAYFESLYRWNNGLSIISGSAAFISLIEMGNANVALIAISIITLSNTLSLVFDISTKARLHGDLRRKFLALEKLLLTDEKPDINLVKKLKGEILSVEAEEPNTMRALDAVAHNHFCHAFGAESSKLVIPWYIRISAQIINWDCTNLKKHD